MVERNWLKTRETIALVMTETLDSSTEKILFGGVLDKEYIGHFSIHKLLAIRTLLG